MENVNSRGKGISKITTLLLIVCLIAIGTGVYFYIQYKQIQLLLQHPNATAVQQIQEVVAKVSKLMDLPTDEQPTIATVSDITKLKNQPFFQHAKNGDNVLIYTKAKIAILYDPTTNKIVTVAPLNIGQGIVPSPSQVRVAIYIATTSANLSDTVSKELITKFANITIVSKKQASRIDYKNNLVVDLNGNQQNVISQIAQMINGSIAKLPSGEVKPNNTDILLIIYK